jgi:hypothetical protein
MEGGLADEGLIEPAELYVLELNEFAGVMVVCIKAHKKRCPQVIAVASFYKECLSIACINTITGEMFI